MNENIFISSPNVTIVDQTPDYRTITEGGRVFHRISDAIAEFCDNSIQSIRCNTIKVISNSLILNNNANSYYVICDNGHGKCPGVRLSI
jgi:hypothetical protein